MSTDVRVEKLLRKELVKWVVISLMEETSALCQRYSFHFVHFYSERVTKDSAQIA